MADNEVKVICSYCKGSVKTKKVICKNCLTPFHKSCAMKKTKKCCEKQQYDEIEEPENCVVMEETENVLLIKEQNKLLKQIISDKEVIIADKEKLIKLLEAKVIKLEIELVNTNKNRDKSQTEKNNVLNTEVSKEIKVNEHKQNIRIPKQRETKNNPNYEDEKVRKNENLMQMETAQINTMKKLIYLNNDEGNLQNENEIQEIQQPVQSAFKTVSYKKKGSSMKYKVGQVDVNEESDDKAFIGRAHEKRVWVFISKIKDHVSEEVIKKYLEAKAQNKDQILVEEISTFRKIKDNKCFKIGLEYTLKDKVYDVSFWPRGVAFQKYDFKKGDRYSKRISEGLGNFMEERQLQQNK